VTIWTIVPVKPLRRGKSRLSGILSEDERTQLNYSMLANTLHILSAVPEIDQVLVVSRDPAVLSLTRDFNFRTLQEDDDGADLNLALKRASIVAQFYGANSILVLPADLPLLKPWDIQDILKSKNRVPVMVIAPDRRGDGTNALFTAPVGVVEFHYGPGSFKKHVEQAEKHNIPVEILETESLQLDLDIPEDLELLQRFDNSLPFTISPA
jgi:2-phospho-L-lactate guanylyltransferase